MKNGVNKRILNFIKRNKPWFIISLVLIIIPFVFYLCNFKNSEISIYSQDWGSFGDFISGTVGTIISLITILFLLINYIELKKEYINAEERYKKQIEQMKIEHNENKDFLKAEIFDKFAEKYITVEFENYIKLLLKMRKNLDLFVEKIKNYQKVKSISVQNIKSPQIGINKELDDIKIELGLNNIDPVNITLLENLTKENIIIPYLKILYKKHPNKEFLELDKARRQVSNFFQRMGILYTTNNLDSRHLTKFWNNFHADNIIYKIIIPMENFYKSDENPVNVKYLKIIADVFKEGDNEK